MGEKLPVGERKGEAGMEQREVVYMVIEDPGPTETGGTGSGF